MIKPNVEFCYWNRKLSWKMAECKWMIIDVVDGFVISPFIMQLKITLWNNKSWLFFSCFFVFLFTARFSFFFLDSPSFSLVYSLELFRNSSMWPTFTPSLSMAYFLSYTTSNSPEINVIVVVPILFFFTQNWYKTTQRFAKRKIKLRNGLPLFGSEPISLMRNKSKFNHFDTHILIQIKPLKWNFLTFIFVK